MQFKITNGDLNIRHFNNKTFMAQVYIQAENAKTDRSRCRKCKEFIEEGAVRIAQCYQAEGKTSRPWHHPQCFILSATMKNTEVNDILGYDTLKTPQDKHLVEQSLKNSKQPRTKPKKSNPPQPTDTSNHEKTSSIAIFRKPRQGNQGYSEPQFTQFCSYFKEFFELPTQTLQNLLEQNFQPKNGSKKQLAEKCADGRLLGQIPNCPDCGGGRLRYNRNTGYYTCPGFMDDDEFKKCGRKFDKTEIVRPRWNNQN